MNRLHVRAFALIALLAAGMSACDFDLDSDNDAGPTPSIITSTPTAIPSEDNSTATADNNSSTPTPTQSSGFSTTTPVQPSPTSEAPDASATEPPAGGNQSEARAEIEAIENNVVELRGLELLQDLDEQIIDRQELAIRVEEIIEDEYTPEDARLDTLTYWLLRLIPDRTLDLYQLQIDLLSEQIAGYYDPETDELVVVTDDGELSVIDKVTMAHEIVHALQDQHFDLIAIDEFAVDSDHEAAITALIEGDATQSMTDYLLGYLDPIDLIDLFEDTLTASDTAVLDNAPRYISEGLLFSYESGQVFAAALIDDGGYEAVNAALQDPPSSTEQILHPEKYIGSERDEPIIVGNPDILSDLGNGWEMVREDALGEWDLAIMLEDNGVGIGAAKDAAAGWGGSRFNIYESGSSSLALLTTRWDSNKDASEFADALIASFENAADPGSIWSESDRHFSIVADGDTVILISATDIEPVSAALAILEQSI